MRCVNLLEPIHAGRIVVGGREITARGVDANRVRREIGIVFQSFNLFPHMTVLRNVTLGAEEGARPHAHRRRDEGDGAARALRARRQARRVPGPALRRPAAARRDRTRARDAARLLLLDEVTSALDPELVAEVLEVIRELAETGMTMLIATHEMSFARDVASRVCFLHDGRILEEGPPAQLFASPREERTRQFLQRFVDAGRL